ncbi:MAG: EAL domain-containing protein [Rhodospirillales bacterium]|nr:EAL domain-containing protein [Rhodospirillales bacterium]
MTAPEPQFAAMLRLRYQPIVRLKDGEISHVEVLARILGRDGRLTGPKNLVAAMEHPDRALGLTRTIMQRALSEYKAQAFFARRLPLAFNLPLNVLVHGGIMELIEAQREAHGLSTGLIRFELTETQPVHDIKRVGASIAVLRDAGYQLALDDIVPLTPFLMPLMGTAVSAVKLDRSVVVDARPGAQNFIRGITRLAAGRLQDVVAEGIETTAQQARMLALGVTHGQGFLFAKPLAVEKLAAWLPAGPTTPPS